MDLQWQVGLDSLVSLVSSLEFEKKHRVRSYKNFLFSPRVELKFRQADLTDIFAAPHRDSYARFRCWT